MRRGLRKVDCPVVVDFDVCLLGLVVTKRAKAVKGEKRRKG